MFETKTVEFVETNTALDKIRTMSKEEFIENHGSGTLRKNKKIGLKHNLQYWEERIAYEFGWEFRMLPSTRVTMGNAQTEGDVKGLTEFGWFVERFMSTRVFKEDLIEPVYLQIEDVDGTRSEGNGIFVKQTSFEVPKGYVVFSVITPFNTETGEWEEALNPF